MNSRRRAELQRKLSMGAVPRPPADLLQRLKSDIPKHLEPQPEQEVPLRSMALTMRIAASLILLFTTGLITWRVMETRPDSIALVRDERMFPAVQRATRSKAEAVAAGSSAPAVATIEAVRLEAPTELAIPEATPVVSSGRTSPVATSAIGLEDDASGNAASVADTRERDAARTAETPREETFEFAPELRSQAPAPAPAAPPSVVAQPQQVAPPPPPRVAHDAAERQESETITVTASAPALATTAASATRTASASLAKPERKSVEPSLTAKARVLGISVDPHAFEAVRDAVARGDIAPSEGIDVSAIVNYFAGTATKAPSKEIGRAHV